MTRVYLWLLRCAPEGGHVRHYSAGAEAALKGSHFEPLRRHGRHVCPSVSSLKDVDGFTETCAGLLLRLPDE